MRKWLLPIDDTDLLVPSKNPHKTVSESKRYVKECNDEISGPLIRVIREIIPDIWPGLNNGSRQLEKACFWSCHSKILENLVNNIYYCLWGFHIFRPVQDRDKEPNHPYTPMQEKNDVRYHQTQTYL